MQFILFISLATKQGGLAPPNTPLSNYMNKQQCHNCAKTPVPKTEGMLNISYISSNGQ
jgi:hypothetical protein